MRCRFIACLSLLSRVITAALLVSGAHPAAFAQSNALPYLWRAGDITFAYPADWSLAETLNPPQLTLTAPEGLLSVRIESLQTPSAPLATLLTERANGPALPILLDEQAGLAIDPDPTDTLARAARGISRADGSILILSASGDNAETTRSTLDRLISSVRLSAYQLPRVPDTSNTFYERVGDVMLQDERPALGQITADASEQVWSFAGARGQAISLYASDINRLETLNLRLQVFAPDGSLIAQNDNHPGSSFFGFFSLYDAGLYELILPVEGQYTVMVDSIFGEGIYAIGLRQTVTFTLQADAATRLQGTIDDVFPGQLWSFSARAGEVYTFTMLAAAETSLDPALRLYAPDGSVLEQNDDAADPSLGLNAQLVQVVMPADGLYRLEATRYAGEGTGAYEVVIVPTF